MMNYSPPSLVGTTSLRVSGMTCDHCVRAITAEVTAVPGVDQVDVDLSTGTVTVSVAQPVDRADVVAAVQEAGYTVTA